MKNYLDDLTRERENDIDTVRNIMQSVSPYFLKRIVNDALEAYQLYLTEEVERNRAVMGELQRKPNNL